MQTTRTPPRRPWARGALLWVALALACGESDNATGPEREPRDRSSDTDEPATTDAPSPDIAVAMNDATTRSPFDATPSPDAKDVYYTALAGDAVEPVPGVFVVAADGGAIRTLAMGEPLTAPVNISVSIDGATLFVADPAAGTVFTLPSAGGTPVSLAGTSGYAPRGLAVAKLKDEREYLYFTGRAPDTQRAGVFRVATTGGAVEIVAAGEPFTDPAGVVVDADAIAYVVDTGAEGPSARVLRVANGQISTFVDGIGVGFPAGITLTRAGSTLLVSGLDPDTQRDVVYYVDTATQQLSRLTDTVGEFREPAGLHRAHNADVFAWADSSARDTGAVFMLR